MAERAPGLTRTYKIAEIAAQYQVTEKRVYGWIKERRLVVLRLPGRNGHVSLRVRQEDLDDFVRQWLDQGSESPSTGSGGAADTGPLAGPTPIRGKQSPFQRGKVMKLVPKSGGTSS